MINFIINKNFLKAKLLIKKFKAYKIIQTYNKYINNL